MSLSLLYHCHHYFSRMSDRNNAQSFKRNKSENDLNKNLFIGQ